MGFGDSQAFLHLHRAEQSPGVHGRFRQCGVLRSPTPADQATRRGGSPRARSAYVTRRRVRQGPRTFAGFAPACQYPLDTAMLRNQYNDGIRRTLTSLRGRN